MVSSLTQKLCRLYREAFEANVLKLGSTEATRHTEGLFAVFEFGWVTADDVLLLKRGLL